MKAKTGSTSVLEPSTLNLRNGTTFLSVINCYARLLTCSKKRKKKKIEVETSVLGVWFGKHLVK